MALPRSLSRTLSQSPSQPRTNRQTQAPAAAQPAFLPRSVTQRNRPTVSPAPAQSDYALPSGPKVQLVQATEEYFPADDYAAAIEQQLDDQVDYEPSPCDNTEEGSGVSPCDTDDSISPLLPAPADDEDPFSNVRDAHSVMASQENSATSSRLSDMRLGKVFTRLDSLPDKFIPSPEPSSRDPYFGTSSRLSKKWAPRNLAHRTLYFEDMPLERYGLTKTWYKQMMASATEFFLDAARMPFRWGKEEPCSLHYTLGQERAGSCPPHIKEKACPVP